MFLANQIAFLNPVILTSVRSFLMLNSFWIFSPPPVRTLAHCIPQEFRDDAPLIRLHLNSAVSGKSQARLRAKLVIARAKESLSDESSRRRESSEMSVHAYVSATIIALSRALLNSENYIASRHRHPIGNSNRSGFLRQRTLYSFKLELVVILNFVIYY